MVDFAYSQLTTTLTSLQLTRTKGYYIKSPSTLTGNSSF